MKYLEIRNWHEFQHYKNRTPPWIKLHFNLLTSHDWVMAGDSTKLTMLVCMMIGSRNEGKVPLDPEYIRRAANLAKQPDLKPLIECGFFGDAKILLADASAIEQADAIIEEKREEKKREEEKLTKMPFKDFPDEWRVWTISNTSLNYERMVDTWQDFLEYWTLGKGKNTKRGDWFRSWKKWCEKYRTDEKKKSRAGEIIV